MAKRLSSQETMGRWVPNFLSIKEVDEFLVVHAMKGKCRGGRVVILPPTREEFERGFTGRRRR